MIIFSKVMYKAVFRFLASPAEYVLTFREKQGSNPLVPMGTDRAKMDWASCSGGA